MPPAPSVATTSLGPDATARGEGGGRRRGIARRSWRGERIGQHGRTGHRQSIEEAAARGVRRQQRFDLVTQRLVFTGCRSREGRALLGRPFHGGLKQRLHPQPSLVGHGQGVGTRRFSSSNQCCTRIIWAGVRFVGASVLSASRNRCPSGATS